jgi:hypothetical protein
LKPNDLYQITFKEFLNNNPELKKLNKEIQSKRYTLFEEDRKNNIKKCIQHRKDLISATKKCQKTLTAPKPRNVEGPLFTTGGTKRKNTKLYTQSKKIVMSDNSYEFENSSGNKSLITKEELDEITCLQKEKSKIGKQVEENEKYLERLLKSEIIKEKKFRKIKEQINKKNEKIKKFMNAKNEEKKYLQNERYQDNQDIHERKILYEKINQNNEKINLNRKEAKKLEKDSAKMEKLIENIKKYEEENDKYRQKIIEMFDIKDINKPIESKKFDKSNPNLGKRRLIDIEEKYEVGRNRREKALLVHKDKYEEKINKYIADSEKKENQIMNQKKKVEKEREEKRMLHNLQYDEKREKIKENEKKKANQRKKMLENIEKKELKNFAIKQEKIKLFEERKKLNMQNNEEREVLKAKLLDALKEKTDINELDKDENFINNIINN